MRIRRSHTQDRLARVYDAEILPIWSARFGRLLLRDLPLPPRAMVLDVGAATGGTALELLRHMDDAGRIISIDPSPALLDVARTKAGVLGGKRIFFRSESPAPRLSFTDEVFDLVVCNLVLGETPDPARALADFTRVTKRGGAVAVSLPLAGTFDELHDLLREAMRQLGRHEAVRRLDAWRAALPTAARLRSWMEAAGLTGLTIEQEDFTLAFRSGHEFFFAPLIEFGPLQAWKELAGGRGADMQAVFARTRDAIDALGGPAFSVTVRAAVARGRRPTEAEESARAARRPQVDDPTTEVQLDGSGVELVETTHASFVGALAAPDRAGFDEDDDTHPLAERARGRLPSGGGPPRR